LQVLTVSKLTEFLVARRAGNWDHRQDKTASNAEIHLFALWLLSKFFCNYSMVFQIFLSQTIYLFPSSIQSLYVYVSPVPPLSSSVFISCFFSLPSVISIITPGVDLIEKCTANQIWLDETEVIWPSD
jgi:hypothetical protein